ncbi:MAG: Lrp/AsnC family transcriptional regulator [Clostridia bacterium]|nr:Lrp/AsnC family transcriptional regulator [Clostridia bacterium]
MNTKILKLIENNARLEARDIAAALAIEEDDVKREIAAMERAGIIRGYKSIIDWGEADRNEVSALIELKVVPVAGLGFEEVAERIAKYPSVESVSLMSGVCDLLVTVKGKSFQEVCSFVANELAVIEGVSSTSTQFVMRKYKEWGVELLGNEDDGRSKISL